jgi:hypothetical protein
MHKETQGDPGRRKGGTGRHKVIQGDVRETQECTGRHKVIQRDATEMQEDTERQRDKGETGRHSLIHRGEIGKTQRGSGGDTRRHRDICTLYIWTKLSQQEKQWRPGETQKETVQGGRVGDTDSDTEKHMETKNTGR